MAIYNRNDWDKKYTANQGMKEQNPQNPKQGGIKKPEQQPQDPRKPDLDPTSNPKNPFQNPN